MEHLVHEPSGAWVVPPRPEDLFRAELSAIRAELSDVKELVLNLTALVAALTE